MVRKKRVTEMSETSDIHDIAEAATLAIERSTVKRSDALTFKYGVPSNHPIMREGSGWTIGSVIAALFECKEQFRVSRLRITGIKRY